MSGSSRPAGLTAEAHWRATLVACPRVAALLVAATTVGAALAAIAPAAARTWLGFTFPGVPRSLAEASAILAHNLRILGTVAGLVLIAQLPLATRTERAVVGTLRLAGECLLAGMTAANVLVVGAALGAYGLRMVVALLPHGPIELAAYALALTLYGHVRAGAYPVRDALALLAACAGLLAIAAALEVFAAP